MQKVRCYFKKASTDEKQMRKIEMRKKRFEEYLNISRRQILDDMNELALSEEFLTIKPLPGFIKAANNLSPYYHSVCATARPEGHRKSIEKVLDKNVPGVFREIVTLDLEHDQGKIPYCNTRNFFALIDDGPQNFAGINETKMKGVLYSQPWNVNYLAEINLQRKDNWEAIENYFLSFVR